ncbi:hypothetical protein SAMN00768000_3117 [Sulfobacillus thermosulfidooxidans DSM 9293]|uniref:Uncharacterized protein n=1 Tax=Sulfobacillus thermosulfidooxidans (strain DSM 9293 / VKM B-1269 / AT-1) TaxID=929705 RepID=A0A1W1WKY6_SULTA|nr:hypothetical protein SAMN00768000_3117 [Sulfobacillus thermosulfidooxidans DSM 9293]
MLVVSVVVNGGFSSLEWAEAISMMWVAAKEHRDNNGSLTK